MPDSCSYLNLAKSFNDTGDIEKSAFEMACEYDTRDREISQNGQSLNQGSKNEEIVASKCKSPSVALGFVQAAGLACHERGAESQSKSGICLLGVCENQTNFGTVFGSTSGTWNKPRLLAFLTSGPKTGTKNEPKLDTKNGHQSRLRNSRKSATQAARKISTSELLRQTLIHNCITQRRGT